MSIDIQRLLGPGISAKTGDLAEFTRQNLVKVEAHVGRNRGYIPMPAKQLGFKAEKLGANGKAFYDGHMQAGRLSLIPTKVEARFGCLEARLRNAIRHAEVCDGMIPIATYDMLKASYEDIRKEYLEARDEVVADWDTLVRDFQCGAEEMLGGVRMQKRAREQLYKVICAQIPSKENYERSFYMGLSVTAFPASAAPDGLSASVAADIERSWKDNVVGTALKSIELAIGEGFSMLGKAATAYAERGVIPSKTLDAMARYGSDMAWKNVFQNPALSMLARRMKAVGTAVGTEAKEVIIEEGLLDMWGYAKQMGLSLELSVTPFTEDVLDTMLALRQQEQQRQMKIS